MLFYWICPGDDASVTKFTDSALIYVSLIFLRSSKWTERPKRTHFQDIFRHGAWEIFGDHKKHYLVPLGWNFEEFLIVWFLASISVSGQEHKKILNYSFWIVCRPSENLHEKINLKLHLIARKSKAICISREFLRSFFAAWMIHPSHSKSFRIIRVNLQEKINKKLRETNFAKIFS